MEEFPSNQYNTVTPASKRTAKKDEPEKVLQVDKIITGEAVQRKKPWTRRFAETFTGSDNQGVMDYILFDVLVPAAKDMVADAVSQGVERKLFGEPRSSGRRSRGGHTNYHGAYKSPLLSRPDPRSAPSERRARVQGSAFEEIILDSRVEANAVLNEMYNIIDQYDAVTVANLYGLVGMSHNYIDGRWGWTDLDGAKPTRLRSGQFLLELPRPEPLD